MYVQPFDGSVSPNGLAMPAENAESGGTFFPGGATAAPGDNISRFQPPWLNDGSAPPSYGDYGGSSSVQGLFGPLMGVLQQLMQMLQSLMGYGCNGSYGSGGSCPSGGNVSSPPNGSGNCSRYGNERYFQNAAGSSDGDPHLSFNGAHWKNMASQPDLLNSNSIAGGFRISTQVTPPNAKDVTWNQSATVSLNGGATNVTMNNNGEASITSYGQPISIDKGQTIHLGNGESVTYEQNGSLQVTVENGDGGRIETTLSSEGKGVSVDVAAHDVDLGGTLVNGYEERDHTGRITAPIEGPIPQPYPPNPEPVGGGILRGDL